MLNIKPIKLLKGSHKHTDKTGQGCFMNVVAYLNGEETITDDSPCVCSVVRPVVRRLNDFATDAERARLVPFILRALNSATTDSVELHRRAHLVFVLAQEILTASLELSSYDINEAQQFATTLCFSFESIEYSTDAEKYALHTMCVQHVRACIDRAFIRGKGTEAFHNYLFEQGLLFLDSALPALVAPLPVGVNKAVCVAA